MDESGPFWKTRRFRRRAGSASAALGLSGVAVLVRSVVLARTLGPDSFGAVILAISVADLITIFLDLSLEEAVVHHGTRALVDKNPGRLRGLLRTAVIVDIVVGVVVTLALILAAGPVSDLVSRGRLEPDLLQLAALSVLPATATGTTGAALMVAGRADLRAWMLCTSNLLRLAVVFGASLMFDGPRAILLSLVVATAAGAAVETLVSWRVAWRRWERAETGESIRGWARTLISFGIHTSVTSTVNGSQGALMATLLGRLAGPIAVGIFVVAKTPVRLARAISGPVRILLLPEQARLSAEGRVQELRGSVRAYVFWAFVLGIPAAVAGWFLLPWLIPALYSSGFEAAVEPARLLLIAALLTLATGWAKPLAAAVGRPWIRTLVTVGNLTLVVSLTFVFGHRGAEGAAIVLTIANVVTALAWFVLARFLLGRPGQVPTLPESAPRERARR